MYDHVSSMRTSVVQSNLTQICPSLDPFWLVSYQSSSAILGPAVWLTCGFRLTKTHRSNGTSSTAPRRCTYLHTTKVSRAGMDRATCAYVCLQEPGSVSLEQLREAQAAPQLLKLGRHISRLYGQAAASISGRSAYVPVLIYHDDYARVHDPFQHTKPFCLKRLNSDA